MVMHARKPQRLNDGYFEKHQSHSYQSSKYNSKRDYERNDRVSSYRDRDISPGSGSVSLNNGNSYRSQSPEIDSPSSRGHGGGGGGGGGGSSSHDIRDRGDHRGGGGGGGGGDRYSYIQKMRDRDRDVYKKDKYSEKRDRRGNDRDSESHRTNHDRGERRGGGSGGGGLSSSGKFCSSNDKRSGSDDRERERDRDRDIRDLRDKRDHRGGSDERKRERERDLRENERRRGGAGAGGGGGGGGSGSGGGATGGGGGAGAEDKRGGDRGERVARYGDWSEHVSSSGKMYYYNCKTEVSQWEKPKEWIERERNLTRDQHREKDYRDKERDRERDDRFSRSAYTKHSSSRGNARLRWNYDNDGRPPTHRRRLDGRLGDNVDMDISPGDSTPTSEASYSLSGTPITHGVGGCGGSQQHNNDQSTTIQSTATTVGLPNALPRLASHPNASSLTTTNANCTLGVASAAVVNPLHCNASPASTGGGGGGGNGVGGSATMLPTTGLASSANPVITTNNNHRKLDSVTLMQHQTHLSQGSASSPNTSGSSLTNQVDHHLNSNAPGPPKLGGHKESQQHARLSQQQHNMEATHNSVDAANHAIRENALNSPLYNLTHSHGMSPLHYTRSPLTTASGVVMSGHANSVPNSTYSCNTNFALKTVENSGVITTGCNSNANNSNNSINLVGGSNTLTSCSTTTNSLNNNVGSNNALGMLPGEGPPTPTQELDTSGTSIDQQQQQQQRKMDGTSSATLSSLQSCVSSSVQAGRLQGPEISPKLAKYFRSDLIQHVTNWQADILESQCQKLSEEAHLYGDLQCTKVSAELKCARSLVRITEITATLQEQRIMYLRQQIRRLEESKSQNSFMSDDL